MAIGDLAMNCPQGFISNYLVDVLKIMDSASKLSLTTANYLGDEDMMEYLEKLRETLVECYTTLVHGVKQTSFIDPLVQQST